MWSRRGEFATQATLERFKDDIDFQLDFLGTLLVIQLAIGVFRVPHQHMKTILQLRCQLSACSINFAILRYVQAGATALF